MHLCQSTSGASAGKFYLGNVYLVAEWAADTHVKHEPMSTNAGVAKSRTGERYRTAAFSYLLLCIPSKMGFMMFKQPVSPIYPKHVILPGHDGVGGVLETAKNDKLLRMCLRCKVHKKQQDVAQNIKIVTAKESVW